MKDVFVGIRNFIFLLVIFNVFLSIADDILDYIRAFRSDKSRQIVLPVYKNNNWANQYFLDEKKLALEYAPFTGYQSQALSSSTINISKEGFRHSRNDSELADIVFLGASIMFGIGSDDAHTIPSLFSTYTRDSLKVRNLGTNGASVFQNYIILEKYTHLYKKPEIVVSFEGGIETLHIMQGSEFEISHLGADVFENAVKQRGETPISKYLNGLIDPMKRGVIWTKKKVIGQAPRGNEKEYQEALKKVDQYALLMVTSWERMYRLCRDEGIAFYCFYSPIITGNSQDISAPHVQADLLHYPMYKLALKEELYNRVIGLLRTERFSALSGRFTDLSTTLDNEQYMYIDAAHYSPQGNAVIAQEMINSILKK